MNEKIDKQELGERIIENFKKLNTVARGSNNEMAVSALLMDFAKGLGLNCGQDKAYNVVMIKNDQKSDDMRPVILQAHMDMVCAVDEDHKDYDFLENPIYPKTEQSPSGEYIMTGRGTKRNESGEHMPDDAIRTTLGADDGIGVASVMTILEDQEITHPPIIAIFTTGEEIGMVGAKKMEIGFIQKIAEGLDLNKARFINVDEEKDGRFCYGCAGGAGVELNLSYQKKEAFKTSEYEAFRLSVSGLIGGHSGVEIDKRHANANRLIGRMLYSFLEEEHLDIALFSIAGGSAENAIAAFGNAEIAIQKEDVDKLKSAFQTIQTLLLKEYKEIEKDMVITLDSISIDGKTPMTDENRNDMVYMIYLIPNDVLGFLECDGYSVVETSGNLGTISMDESKVKFECSVRSFYDPRRDFVISQIKKLAELFHFEIYVHDAYSGWAQSPDSKLKVIFNEAYKKLFPGDPVGGRLIHAGLECGVFVEILGDIDMIACGPTILDVHTPKETLYLDTVPKTGLLLIEVLERLTEKEA